MNVTLAQESVAGLSAVMPTLLTALALAEVYKEQGNADAAEGARQTARAALDRADEHLRTLRTLCC